MVHSRQLSLRVDVLDTRLASNEMVRRFHRTARDAASRQVGGILGIAIVVAVLATYGADALSGARASWYFVVALAASSAVASLWLPRRQVSE